MTEAPSPIDDRFRPLVQALEEGIPFNRYLRVQVERLTPGSCVLRVPWAPHLVGDPLRPAVHGGVTAALIDTAGGGACFSMLGRPEDRISTVDMRVDYLRPGAGEDLFCEAKVVRMGNRVAVTRMEVFLGPVPPAGAERDPIATGQGVYNVLRRSERK